jgi:hypothetical protein
VIYIQHTSFRLYHCYFPQTYLREMHKDGQPPLDSPGVTLEKTREYNFADTDQRGEWFDIFVALIQYLLSGESKVGFLNNISPGNWNLIHKVLYPGRGHVSNGRTMRLGRRGLNVYRRVLRMLWRTRSMMRMLGYGNENGKVQDRLLQVQLAYILVI